MSRAEAIAAFQEQAARLAAEERKNPAAPAGVRGFCTCAGSGHRLSDETWAPQDRSEPPSIDVIYLHGVCESADTLPVRNLAAAVLHRGWRLRVPEHHGHGDSDGRPGLIHSFDVTVDDAAEYIGHCLSAENAAPSFALIGHSLGATVAAYLGGRLREQYGARFLGAVLLAPAVGADPAMLPPAPVIALLRVVSWMAPALRLPATPFEEPAGYCASDPPPGRNFRGHWPLGTSKVLLELTSERVPRDCLDGGLLRSAPAAFPAVVAIGRGDAMVPQETIEAFAAALTAAAAATSLVQPRVVEVGVGHQPLMGPGGSKAADSLIREVAGLASSAGH